MRVEALIATMYRKDLSFIENMNVLSPYVIVNQTNYDKYPFLKDANLKVISNEERGLSKSRNLALSLAENDICLIADDDICYIKNYQSIVSEAYEKLTDADVIVFDYSTSSLSRKCSKISSDIKQLSLLDTLKVSSVRISFKRASIISKSIRFDELFGSGAIFQSGEENIFLKDCIDSGLKIFYYPAIICDVDFEDSTWFNGFDKRYFETKGAFSSVIFGNLYLIYIIQFLLRKYKLYSKTTSFLKAFSYCLKGRKKYLNLK